jgi:hypothetical protein
MFAVYAYILFDHDLNLSDLDGADDDAQRWGPLYNLLNFRTFPQSLHTMFQLRWSLLPLSSP